MTTKRTTITLTISYAAAFLTGTAALAYEVVWAQMLVIPLGSSADALALVLSAFMIGLALGALFFGTLADRSRYPLRLYAILETALALFVLVMPVLIELLSSDLLFRGSFEEAPVPSLLRFIAAFLLVAAPSLLMGASVPVLVRGLSFRPYDMPRRIGPLYGLSTLGGATGAALAGFLCIPSVGLRLTSHMGVVLNLSAVVLALIVSRSAVQLAAEPGTSVSLRASPGTGRVDKRAFAALLAAALVGFSMLVLGTLWARILKFVFGFDTYALAVLLVIVLFGLGGGGILFRALSRRDPADLLPVVLGFLACSTLASFWAAAELFPVLRHDAFGFGHTENPVVRLRMLFILEMLYVPVLAFLPSLFAGMAFPASCALFSGPAGRSGRRVGLVTLVNGFGCAAGALTASFVLIPLFGLGGTLLLLSSLVSVTAVGVMFLAGRSLSIGRTAFSGGAAALAIVIVIAMPSDLPSKIFLVAAGPKHQDLLHYNEGRVNTVAVTLDRVSGEKQLFINSISEATTRLVHDQSFKLLGHLGMLLHRNPREALAIGLGGGLSAGAAIQHPLTRLDVVEIDPAVTGGTGHFAEENNNLLDDPRFTLHINDGRQFLSGTARSYDVIFIDSTHPKAADSWILFTEEFYELVRRHLGQDGIALQWVPIHGLSEQEFKIIVRTFHAVFPEITLWVNLGFGLYGQSAYVKMVGTKRPLTVDYRSLAKRLAIPAVHDDLEPFGMADPVEILDCFLGGPEAIAPWAGELPIQTDDRPLVPYTTRYSAGPPMSGTRLYGLRSPVLRLLSNMGGDEVRVVAELQKANDSQVLLMANRLNRAAEVWPEGRKIGLYREKWAGVPDYYSALSELYPESPERLRKIGVKLHDWGFTEDARELFENTLALNPDDGMARTRLAIVYRDLGDVPKAVDLLTESLRGNPEDALAAVNLGYALMASGNLDEAESQLRKVIEMSDGLRSRARYFLSLIHLQREELDEAEAELHESIAAVPWFADAWYGLGLIAEKRRDRDAARTHFSMAIDADPFLTDALFRRGNLYLSENNYELAIRDYTQAVLVASDFARAFLNRGVAYAQRGSPELAVRDFSRALEINPSYGGGYINRARAYYALEEYPLAWGDVKKFQEMGGSAHPDFLERLKRASEK